MSAGSLLTFIPADYQRLATHDSHCPHETEENGAEGNTALATGKAAEEGSQPLLLCSGAPRLTSVASSCWLFIERTQPSLYWCSCRRWSVPLSLLNVVLLLLLLVVLLVLVVIVLLPGFTLLDWLFQLDDGSPSPFRPSSLQSTPVSYLPVDGLLRAVSLSQLPHLVSSRRLSSTVASDYPHHPDFNRFQYRDFGAPSVAGTVNSSHDSTSTPTATSLLNTLVMTELSDGPGCVASGFFAFTAGCEVVDEMSFKVEVRRMDSYSGSSSSTQQLQWITRAEIALSLFGSPPPELRWFDSPYTALQPSEGCRYHSGVHFTAPICYSAAEHIRLSIVWDRVAEEATWRQLLGCVSDGSTCPIGIYFNLWLTHRMHDSPTRPLAIDSALASDRSGEDDEEMRRVEEWMKQRYGRDSQTHLNSVDSPPLHTLSPSFNPSHSASQMRADFALHHPSQIHPIFIPVAARVAPSTNLTPRTLLPSDVQAAVTDQPATLTSVAASAAATATTAATVSRSLFDAPQSARWRNRSVLSAAGGGCLSLLFHRTLSASEVVAGGAVLAGLRLSTLIADRLDHWRGLDLVVYWDGGDRAADVFPQHELSAQHEELVKAMAAVPLEERMNVLPSGRAQVDAPIALLFGLGSSSEKKMLPSGSIALLYREIGNRSIGELLYPMPFWRSVAIFFRNRRSATVDLTLQLSIRTDVHYVEELSSHLYAHYSFAQSAEQSYFDQSGSRLLHPDHQLHWAEKRTRPDSCGSTETEWALQQIEAEGRQASQQQHATAIRPTAAIRPSANSSLMDWLQSAMAVDRCGHNPSRPRGSFVYANLSDPSGIGMWQLHSAYNLTGHLLHWVWQYTADSKEIIENDVRVLLDERVGMSTTGSEDMFLGGHGYVWNVHQLTESFGWRFFGDLGSSEGKWRNYRQYRVLHAEAPTFSRSVMLGWEMMHRHTVASQSLLLFYAKPLHALPAALHTLQGTDRERQQHQQPASISPFPSGWGMQVTDEVDVGSLSSLQQHGFALLRQSATGAAAVVVAPSDVTYGVRDGQSFWLVWPWSEPSRIFDSQMEYSDIGHLIINRTQVHLNVTLHPQHAQCFLTRRVDSCSSVQAARVYIRPATGGIQQQPQWATAVDLEAEWLDGGLWLSTLQSCAHVHPEGRFVDVRHPLPFQHTQGREGLQLLLDVSRGEPQQQQQAMDAALLQPRLSLSELSEPLPFNNHPLRSFNYFHFTVECSFSPLHRTHRMAAGS